MTYKSLKTRIKDITRKYAPLIYPFVYKASLRFSNSKIEKSRIEKYSRFVRPGFYPFELGKIKFDMKLDPANGGVDMDIFADKYYESKILELVGSLLKKEDTFIDIGANIGQHSMYASYFCKHVYSFEPVKKLFNQFNESISKNLILNISTYNYALGNEKKRMPIYSNGVSMAASSINTVKNKKYIQDIQILRFDDVYEKMNIGKAELIKIDVEGYELEVLLGAKEYIKKYKPKILLEFSPYFYRRIDATISDKIISFLVDSKYKVYDLGEYNDKRIPIFKLKDISNTDQVNLLCE